MAAGHMRNLLRKSPYWTSVGIYTALYTSADVCNQVWQHYNNKKLSPDLQAFSLDVGRTARMGVMGFACLGNLNYVWIHFLERLLPGATVRKTLAKVVLDTVIAGPLFIVAFYAGLRVLERKPDIFAVAREKFLPTYKTSLMFWPAAQTINFYLLPLQYRVIYLGFCSFTWANFLCFMKVKADQELQATGAGNKQDLQN